jgi:uncharacterized BrkB/YihY/UPF0761 family membrane protein
MSDNPFASSPKPEEGMPAPGQQFVPPQQAPGALTAISVICLILGVLGLLGSCTTIGGLIAQGFGVDFNQFVQEMSGQEPDETQKKLQELTAAANNKMVIPGIVLTVLRLIVALLLTLGSIFCLRRKEKGRTTLRKGLLSAIFYCVLYIGFSIYSTMSVLGFIKQGFEEFAGDQQNLEQILPIITWSAIGLLVFFCLFYLVLMAFYFWARGYLNKEQVISYFASSPVGH